MLNWLFYFFRRTAAICRAAGIWNYLTHMNRMVIASANGASFVIAFIVAVFVAHGAMIRRGVVILTAGATLGVGGFAVHLVAYAAVIALIVSELSADTAHMILG